MRTAYQVKTSIHLVIGACVVATSMYHLRHAGDAALGWYIALALGFLTLMVEAPELMRVDHSVFETPMRAEKRAKFEAHYVQAGHPVSAFARRPDGDYALAALNEAWCRWQGDKPFGTAKAAVVASSPTTP